NNPQDKTIIEEIFRAAHTLKGMAATMRYNNLADLTHNLENVFDAIRNDHISVQTELIDILFDTVDHLNAIVEDITEDGKGNQDVSNDIAYLQEIEKGSTNL